MERIFMNRLYKCLFKSEVRQVEISLKDFLSVQALRRNIRILMAIKH